MDVLAATSKSDLFVSVVAPVRNAEGYVEGYVRDVARILASRFKDYEVVLIDDHSRDGTVQRVQALQQTIPNIQLYCLARHIGPDAAFVVGLEHSIGDVVITMDPCCDPVEPFLELIEKYLKGKELIYGLRRDRARRGRTDAYEWLASVFYWLFRTITREDVPVQASSLRLLSRRIVNAFLENRDRYSLFNVIPAFAGFPYAVLAYERINRSGVPLKHDYLDAIGRAISILLLSSKRPLRLMTAGSLAGAFLSLIYGIYVVVVHVVKSDVAEGWASLSLQIAGLFFIQFVILAVLSEYIIRLFTHSQNRLPYLIARESSSLVLSRKAELNVRSGALLPEDAGTLVSPALEKEGGRSAE
jgi:glycosyltransferase involved in cell wall biosynthesis